MLDLFRPLPLDARLENRAAYQKFLAARDGVVNLEKRTLTRREEGMARYMKPLPRVRGIDRALFDAQYASFDPKMATSPETLLLISLVKVNAAEAFGVNKFYEKVFRRAVKNNDALELTLLIEETYHTRILLSSAVLYGIEVTAPFRPPTALRALIGGIAYSPEFMSRPLTLAAKSWGRSSFSTCWRNPARCSVTIQSFATRWKSASARSWSTRSVTSASTGCASAGPGSRRPARFCQSSR